MLYMHKTLSGAYPVAPRDTRKAMYPYTVDIETSPISSGVSMEAAATLINAGAKVKDIFTVKQATYGDWALQALAQIRSRRFVQSSNGILGQVDLDWLDKLAEIDPAMWTVDRKIVFHTCDEMPTPDMDDTESEWGHRPASNDIQSIGYTVSVSPLHKAIHIANDAEEKYGTSPRFIIWHEIAHTLRSETIGKIVGPKKDTETNGHFFDRFAEVITRENK